MADANDRIAVHRLRMENGAYVFTFYCASSGAAVCTTRPVRAQTMEAALRVAWEREGRSQFNFCRQCENWVSDVMYNADTLKCVDCSPWEEIPRFCSGCGERVNPEDVFCPRCQNRLRYGNGGSEPCA